MTWPARSPRKARLPSGWETIRRRVLARDPQCMIGYPDICTGASTDVDHVVPGDDHRLHMLQGACGPCHRRKSAREGGLASGAVRAAKARQRPKSKHPGLV